MTEKHSQGGNYMGFKNRICTQDSETWSEQYYTIKTKFLVSTVTGLEDLNYRDNCECDVIEAASQSPCPCEIVFMVDGSKYMSGSAYYKESLAFMKKFVASVDREVLRKRSQEPITFTVVQFAGNKEAAKHYEPGYGYYQESAVSGKNLTHMEERKTVFHAEKKSFHGKLGQSSEGSYHWKSYKTISSHTIVHEVDAEQESSFDRLVRGELEEKENLGGDRQFFLCLQDLAAASQEVKDIEGQEFTSEFESHLSEKMQRYTVKKQTQRIVISFTDDTAFDNEDVENLNLINSSMENPTAENKKKFILGMASNSFYRFYPIVLKTGKGKCMAEIEAYQKNAGIPKMVVDPSANVSIDVQMTSIKKDIMVQLNLF